MHRILACAAIVLLASCGGPKLTKVSGIVTYKDKPLENVTVQFAPDGDGVVGAATTDANGKYDIGSSLGWGVPPGSYTVKIKPQITVVTNTSTDLTAGLTPGSPEYEQAYKKMMAGGTGNPNDQYKRAKANEGFPDKYQQGALKAMVQAVSSQNIDFKLE